MKAHTILLMATAVAGLVGLEACGSGAKSSNATVTSVQLTPTSLTFNATSGGANPAPQNLSISNTGGGTLNFTAASDSAWLTVAPGSGTAPATLQVSATVGSPPPGTYYGHITVTASGAQGSPTAITVTFIVAAPAAVIVSVQPTSASVAVNQQQPFSATVQNATNTSVTWSVSGTGCSGAACGTISTNGLYTAPGTVPSPASVSVKATSVQDTTKSASAAVTITPSSSGAVTISPRVAAMTTSQQQQFTATVQGTANQSVNWSVDGIPNGNTTVGTMSGGLYTPPAAAGQHSITAISVANGSNASVNVYITDYAGMFTQHNDNARTGQNLQELALSSQTVNSSSFGKLFSCTVDGYVYAQPLYVANLAIPTKGTHNVLIVATENDSVYAFDADSSSCIVYWHASFINPPSVVPIPSGDLPTTSIVPQLGITSTPVIDPSTSTVYIEASTREGTSSFTYMQRLHALDLTTGAEKLGGPVPINVSVSGTGVGASGGKIKLDLFWQRQRTALLLLNGVVYFGFSSHEDNGPWHGWLIGYDATTLQLVAAYNATPNSIAGGIWGAGNTGISADSSSNIYVMTGNGDFNPSISDYADSALKLRFSSGTGLTLLDYFTPYNQSNISSLDYDLGSGSLLILPDSLGSTAHPHLMLGGGKEGVMYLLDRDNLGKFNPSNNSQIVQSLNIIPNSGGYGFFSMPALWQNNVYIHGDNDVLRAYRVQNGLLTSSPVSQSSKIFYHPTPSPTVSANGTTGGIVWDLDVSQFGSSGPAILYAYDATNVATELYATTQAANGRDQCGPAVKFQVPTVANGRVYVGTQNSVVVYGLLP